MHHRRTTSESGKDTCETHVAVTSVAGPPVRKSVYMMELMETGTALGTEPAVVLMPTAESIFADLSREYD